MSRTLGNKLARGLRNPLAAWGTARGLIRGHIFKLWCGLFRRRITIGRNLFLDGKLKIRGPGRVILGDNVMVSMLVTPYTHDSEAVIEIGDKVFLNGTRFGCKQRIFVGSHSILAECRIIDYDFHSIDPAHRNDAAYIKSGPVTIEDNVWIAFDCCILKGVRIGRNSTIGALSLVNTDIPEHSIASGNPAIVLKRLDRSRESSPEDIHQRDANASANNAS